jgi:hypothetical protein
MYKTSTQTLLNLLIAACCATPLAIILPHIGPNAIIALLTTTVTVLLVQVAILRRDLSVLRDKISGEEKA